MGINRRQFVASALGGLSSVSSMLAADADFSFLLIPDPQYLATFCEPYGYDATIQWIIDNISAWKIKCVICVGDCVNNSSHSDENTIAGNAFGALTNAGIPWIACPGNHDYTTAITRDGLGPLFVTGDFKASSRSAVFGTGLSVGDGDYVYWGDSYDSSGANSYIIASVGTQRFVIFSVEVFPRVDVLNWIVTKAALYPQSKVIISTHSYLRTTGVRQPRSSGYGPYQYNIDGSMDYPNGTSGEEMWDGSTGWAGLKTLERLYWVVSGHDLYSVEAGRSYCKLLTSTGNGQSVNQLFANWQDLDIATYCNAQGDLNGTSNVMHLAILKCRPSQGITEVYALSVNSGKWMSGSTANTPADDPTVLYTADDPYLSSVSGSARSGPVTLSGPVTMQ